MQAAAAQDSSLLYERTLGGSGFEREIALGARAVRYIGDDGALDLHYRYDDIDEDDPLFAGIAGSRQRLDLRYRWYRDDHTVILRTPVQRRWLWRRPASN